MPEHDMSSSKRVRSKIRAGVCKCGPVWVFYLSVISKTCGRAASGENM